MSSAVPRWQGWGSFDPRSTALSSMEFGFQLFDRIQHFARPISGLIRSISPVRCHKQGVFQRVEWPHPE